MSDFKAKMHQIRFRLDCTDPLAGFKGPTSKGREGMRRVGGREGIGEGEVEGWEGKGREGMGLGSPLPCPLTLSCPPPNVEFLSAHDVWIIS